MSEFFPEIVIRQEPGVSETPTGVIEHIEEPVADISNRIDAVTTPLEGVIAETTATVPAEHMTIDRTKSSKEIVDDAIRGGCTGLSGMSMEQQIKAVDTVRSPESQQIVREAANERRQAFLAKRAEQAKKAEQSVSDKAKPKDLDKPKDKSEQSRDDIVENHTETSTDAAEAVRKQQAAEKVQSLNVAERTANTLPASTKAKDPVVVPAMVPRRGGSGRRQRERLTRAMADEEAAREKVSLALVNNRKVVVSKTSADAALKKSIARVKNYTQVQKPKPKTSDKKTVVKAVTKSTAVDSFKASIVPLKSLEAAVPKAAIATKTMTKEIVVTSPRFADTHRPAVVKPVAKFEHHAPLAIVPKIIVDKHVLQRRVSTAVEPSEVNVFSRHVVDKTEAITLHDDFDKTIGDLLGWNMNSRAEVAAIAEEHALPLVNYAAPETPSFAKVLAANVLTEPHKTESVATVNVTPAVEQLVNIFETRDMLVEDAGAPNEQTRVADETLIIKARVPLVVESAPTEIQNALQDFSDTIGERAPQVVIEVAGLLEVITTTTLELETQLTAAIDQQDTTAIDALEVRISRQFERLVFCLQLEPSSVQKEAFMAAIHELALSGNLRMMNDTKLKDVMHELIQTLTRLASRSISMPSDRSYGVGHLALKLTVV